MKQAIRSEWRARPPIRRRRAAAAWLLLVVTVVLEIGCGGGGRGPTAPGGAPPMPVGRLRILALSGHGQEGSPGRTLAQPLVVLVTDESGSAREGLTVLWRLLAGDGEILGPRVVLDGASGSATATPTDGRGVASVFVTLGSTPGSLVIEADVLFSTGPVRFEAHSTRTGTAVR